MHECNPTGQKPGLAHNHVFEPFYTLVYTIDGLSNLTLNTEYFNMVVIFQL